MLEKEKIDAMFGETKPADKGYEAMRRLSGLDQIEHPNHYANGRKYEPIDVITDWNLNFNLGNTVKYISRAGRKDPNKLIEDLQKAKFYLDYEISRLEKE